MFLLIYGIPLVLDTSKSDDTIEVDILKNTVRQINVSDSLSYFYSYERETRNKNFGENRSPLF